MADVCPEAELLAFGDDLAAANPDHPRSLCPVAVVFQHCLKSLKTRQEAFDRLPRHVIIE
jgi:hypothetical protein